MSGAAAKSLIDTFLARIAELRAGLEPAGGLPFFVDLLDAVEDHRAQMRAAEWPDTFDAVDAAHYRLLLLDVQLRLAHSIRTLPRAAAKDRAIFDRRVAFLAGLLRGFVERARAVSMSLGGPQLH